ncbi:ATP-binding cassette domain-containing protein [Ovoidimarina sediminis]|uniref:ATP-binding cassette domain-containing protein n=1 Tax=Ovoidimarina sediminis TaxID=3079856 RepID=UPI00290FEC76|nr:ATP-binding cassette domain-containing protein [Rhodophyticola sp. MJ-SS7]MDU8941990.1 ATP-binding cassette domain-containing protein [Rhodophyticola sp. MJ-SS7]
MVELAFDLTLKRPGLSIYMAGAIPLEGVTAVMGPSGSGKTSLLMMLSGLEPQAQGDVRFGEVVWSRQRYHMPPNARRIGMVFQDARLFPHLSVAENIAYGARRRGVSPAAVHGIAEGLGLSELINRQPATLSGGETRRVALARALASGPEILFLDEPLSGLDSLAKEAVLPYLAQAIGGAGIPVVYVTHARDEVTRLADRLLLVEKGRVAGWGVPPAHLAVSIAEKRGDRVRVELGPASFFLPGQGRPGDARRIGLPENGLLLSRDTPGPSGALAVLEVTVREVFQRPAGPVLRLDLSGQTFDWRVEQSSPLGQNVPRPGTRLSMSLLNAYLR